jgi:cobalt-zinc-cadmium resistance protein CzcA
MIARILEWSLAHRGLVIAGWLAIAAGGVFAALRIPLDAFPDTTPVQVQVNTVAEALSPLEIEQQVTRPIEASIGGLPDLVEVRSVSRFGFSQVTATFDDGADLYLARQTVSEKVSSIELPSGVSRPSLGPVATGLGEVFHYLIRGDASLAELRSAHEQIVRPEMMSVRGVAEINTWGGYERQIHVLVDPRKLERYELTLAELARAIEDNSENVGGGTIDAGGGSTLVRGIGLATSIEDVEAMVIAAREGVPIRVREVARVVEDHEIRRGAVTADGTGEVVLGLGFMLVGANSHEVTSGLRARLAEVSRALPAGVEAVPVYDRTTLVDRVLITVGENLLVALVLVLAVVLAFMRDLRAGLIVALTIPLSMLFASQLMLALGIAGSLMSLGAIDFGLLVDSSVIQVENCVHRLSREGGKTRLEVVRSAVQEVRGPTIFGELIIAVVYLPILTLEGIEGRLFRPMALTVLFALAGSMLLSLTLVPVLSSYFLRPARLDSKIARFGHRIADRYARLLAVLLRRPKLVLGGALALGAVAVVLAIGLGSEFVPRLREGTIVINTVRLAGVSVDESVRYGTELERLMLERFPDEIDRVWSRTGTAEIATDPMGVELTDMFLMLKPRDEWTRAGTQDELVREMAKELEGAPGMRSIFTQPIEMRTSEMIAGIRADVGVILYGSDFATLRTKGREIQSALESIEGASDVVTEQLTGQSTLRIEVDRAAIARHGIAARDVLAMVRALGPTKVGTMQEGEWTYPIALRLDDAYRVSPHAVGRLLVSAPNGDHVPLRRLARIEVEDAPSTIQRTWGRRRIIVQANVRGRDVGSFVDDARERIGRIDLPQGYSVSFGGQFEHLERANRRLWIVVPIALLCVLGLLYLTYRRLADALRVFAGVPFAAIGGIVALAMRGLDFSVSAAVGFVALSGIAVLGDMVLVSTIRDRLSQGDGLAEAITSAARRRLRPVLITALVAAIGFLPMALNTGFGGEVQRPLATVVIGGILSSAALTLLVTPVLYLVTSRRRR